MLDEAHSIGVLGKTGRGLSEHFGTDPREVEFIIGTLSKAFASCGGFVCANANVVHWLRFTLPAFVYSVGATPASIGAAAAALAVAKAEPARVARLHANSRHACAAAKARGLDIGRGMGYGIVPVCISSKANALRLSMGLLKRGIYIPPIMQQAVSHDSPRLRMFISSDHTPALLDHALDQVVEVATEIGEPLGTTQNVLPLAAQRTKNG
jgi:8-amino-7-oxononanoate synthase